MKKLICICLLALVLTGLCVSVGATGTEKAVLASSSSVQQGKTVAISVNLSGCDVANGYTVELIYDKDIFELVGGTWQPQDKPFGTDSDLGSFLLDTPEAPNRQILTFTLRAKEDAPLDTDTEVGCNVTLMTDGGEILVAAQPNVIKIACPHDFQKNETSEYRIAAATCEEPARYCKSCSRCGARDESQEFFSGEATGHNYKDREITDYIAEAGDCQNRNIYYVSCAACGERGEQTFEGRLFGEHVYDDDCDAKCNVCYDERTITHVPAEELSSDEKGHWHACTRCEEKVDRAEHIPGPEATAEEPQVCTECGFVISVHEEHVHEYGDGWSADGDGHWQTCACGETTEPEEHSWDTTDPALHVCQICGQTKDVELPQTQPTVPAAPSAEEQEQEGVDVLPIVLGILLGLSLIGNGVLTWLLILAKKKK